MATYIFSRHTPLLSAIDFVQSCCFDTHSEAARGSGIRPGVEIGFDFGEELLGLVENDTLGDDGELDESTKDVDGVSLMEGEEELDTDTDADGAYEAEGEGTTDIESNSDLDEIYGEISKGVVDVEADIDVDEVFEADFKCTEGEVLVDIVGIVVGHETVSGQRNNMVQLRIQKLYLAAQLFLQNIHAVIRHVSDCS